MESSKMEFRFVIFRGSDHWVAQCLEIDLATEVDDLMTLPDEVVSMLKCHFELSAELGKDPLKALGPAPEKYQRMWPAARLVGDQGTWLQRALEWLSPKSTYRFTKAVPC